MKRFDATPSEVPGPGSYDDKFSSIFTTSQTKSTNSKQIPFNQTTPRFVSLNKSRSMPGPSQYRITAFTDDNLRRATIENGKKPPFNVASIRRFNILRKDEYNTPGKICFSKKINMHLLQTTGPSSYDVKIEPLKPMIDHPSANFASKTARELVIEVCYT